MGKVNPWLEERLRGLNSPETLGLILEVDEMERLPEVRRLLTAIPGVSVGRTAFNMVHVQAPPGLVPEIARLPGVTIHYNMPVGIRAAGPPAIWDPLMGEVRVSSVTIPFGPAEMAARLGPGLAVGLATLPFRLLRQFAGVRTAPGEFHQPGVIIIPTGDTREMLELPEENTTFNTRVAVLDTGLSLPHPLLHPSKGLIKLGTFAGPVPFDGLGHGCVHGDALIHTTFCGVATIQEFYDRLPSFEVPSPIGFTRSVPSGVKTLSYKGGRFTPSEVFEAHKIPVKGRAIKVKTKVGQLRLTPWHPIFVWENNKVLSKRADGLKVGDWLIQPVTEHLPRLRPYYRSVYSGWDKRKGRRSHQPYAKTHRHKVRVDEALGYVCGVLVGDGCLTNKGQVTFSLSDGGVEEAILAWMQSKRFLCHTRDVQGCRDIRSGLDLWELLRNMELPVGFKGPELRIPEIILKSPTPVVLAFLAGFFDTDGSVALDRKKVRLVTASLPLARQLMFVLHIFGMSAMLSCQEPAGKGRSRIYTVAIDGASVERFHSLIVPYAKSKKVVLLSAHMKGEGFNRADVVPYDYGLVSKTLRAMPPHKVPRVDRTKRIKDVYVPTSGRTISRLKALEIANLFVHRQHPWRALKNIRLARVNDISEEGVSTFFYDLSVKGAENYLAGSAAPFLVHNTWCATAGFGDSSPTRFGPCRGVADPENGTLGSWKVLSDLGFGSTWGIIQGIEAAYKWGAKVISMSLGGDLQGGVKEDPECRIIERLKDAIIFVVAAGNSGPGDWTVGSPAASPHAITVGAWSPYYDGLAVFSSRGPNAPWYLKNGGTAHPDFSLYRDDMIKPDVVAPGGGPVEEGQPMDLIYSGVVGWMDGAYDLTPLDLFGPMRGSSMACPMAAGVITLAVEHGLVRTAKDVKRLMARWRKKDHRVGYGGITYSKLL